MSLLYGSDFTGDETTFQSGSRRNFYGLFYNDSNLVSSEDLLLPATTLAESCYEYMFGACSSLTTAPELPATTCGLQSYRYMFYGCSSLTTAHELPTTTLKKSSEFYAYMFQNCSKLSSVTCMATNVSNNGSTRNWLSGVASTGSFYTPKDAIWTTGESGIPSGWTRIDI